MNTPGSPRVGVRTLTLRGLPLLVAGVPAAGQAARLLDTVTAAGLLPLPRLSGVELPRGAKVGFTVDQTELRLVDESDAALLRAAREGLDPAWLEAARRLRGTMAVVVRDLEVTPAQSPEVLVSEVDAAAADGRAFGAIVGVVEERPTLPLLFG
jgi:hypothetical protein